MTNHNKNLSLWNNNHHLSTPARQQSILQSRQLKIRIMDIGAFSCKALVKAALVVWIMSYSLVFFKREAYTVSYLASVYLTRINPPDYIVFFFLPSERKPISFFWKTKNNGFRLLLVNPGCGLNLRNLSIPFNRLLIFMNFTCGTRTQFVVPLVKDDKTVDMRMYSSIRGIM